MSAAAMTSSPKISPHSSKPLFDVSTVDACVAARHQLKEQHRPRAADREVGVGRSRRRSKTLESRFVELLGSLRSEPGYMVVTASLPEAAAGNGRF
jgi:hypothetical protein